MSVSRSSLPGKGRGRTAPPPPRPPGLRHARQILDEILGRLLAAWEPGMRQ